VPGGAVPVPAAPGEAGSSPESDSAPAEAPRSQRGGGAPVAAATDTDAPQLATGLRARLGSAYQGLTERLAKLFDRKADIVVLEDRGDPGITDASLTAAEGVEGAQQMAAGVPLAADASAGEARNPPPAEPRV